MKENKGLQLSNEKSKKEALERVKDAYSEWLVTKSNRKNLAKKYKTDANKLRNYIIEKGHRVENFDINTFEVIDTEEKAYWLGFLYADGAISNDRRNSIELSLKLDDFGHLEKFKHFLKCDLSVKKDSFRCRLTLTNGKLRQDLINLGCTPRKSFTITFPTLDSNLERHFIRGFFDGDGCITRSIKNGIWDSASISCASKEFTKVLKDKLSLIVDMNTIVIYNTTPKLETMLFRTYNFTNLMHYLYDDCTIYLDRKYDRYNNSIAVFLRD